MSYAAPAYWNESSGGLPNSGRLSGTVGDLIGISDVAFTAAGYATEYTASNARVYRAASGIRFRFGIDENTAISGDARLATFRGMENASAAGSASWIDPFPTPAQVANNASTILKSTTANTTARAFDLWIWATGFILSINVGGSSNIWETTIFGDVDPSIAGDFYPVICGNRASSSVAQVTGVLAAGSQGGGGATQIHWARTFDGSVKSPTGAFTYPGSTIGAISGVPAARAGPTAGIEAEKAQIIDSGNAASTAASSTLALPKRGIFPYLWLPQHNGLGTVNTRDTAALPSSGGSFSITASTGGAWAMVQTDGWSAPSG